MKGFFSGLLWGGVLGVIGLVIVSQMTLMPSVATQDPGPAPQADLAEPAGTAGAPVPPEPQPEAQAGAGASQTSAGVAEAVQVPAGSEFNRALPDETPTLPGIASAPAPSLAPAVEAPAQGGALPDTDTGPGGAPAPTLLSPEAGAAPEAAVAGVALPEPPAGIAPQSAAPSPDVPGIEPGPDTADLPPPPPLTPEEEALVNPALDTLPAEPAEPETAPLPPEPVLEPVDPLFDADGNPISGDATGAAERPATGFSGAVEGVVTGRLPRIGDAPDAAPAGATDPALLDPIDRYARAFSNPSGKPVFAILLIDRGDPALDRAALAALPFPVTFVLDPTLPDVARLADAYIAAGQEVAMLASAIPQGATAADLEVTFGAHAAALPQAVAVVDLAEGGFQGNRPLATQVIPILQGQGRGLLTYDAGLNAADQVARRDQLRAGTIFRRIDPEGQPAGDIRRVLNRAAFKAAQDGRVAVVGEATPATVAALLEWTVEGRAAAVALAPATAVMIAR